MKRQNAYIIINKDNSGKPNRSGISAVKLNKAGQRMEMCAVLFYTILPGDEA